MSEQIEFFEILSPCQRVCETDKQGYCMTCYRSRDERFNWLKMDDEQKRDVLRLCRQRKLRKHYYLYQLAKQNAQDKYKKEDEQLDLF